MARLFAAEPDLGLDWPESIWTADHVPVVITSEDDGRRLTTMRWGLCAESYAVAVPPKRRGLVYPRDFWRTGSRLMDPTAVSRCVIVLEAFAYPEGHSGGCTRTWVGLHDHPLIGWAGICDESGCAGVLIEANDTIEPLSNRMPRLLAPEDHGLWLDGAGLLSLRPPYPDEAFYRENFEERWSTGRSIESDPLPRKLAG